MTSLDAARDALNRGVLRLRKVRKPTGYTYSYWWSGDRAFSPTTIHRLMREGYATRGGKIVRKRDGVAWRAMERGR